MQITDVQITLERDSRLLALVSITFDDCFLIRGIKIVQGNRRAFVAMPSVQEPDGRSRDIAHPIKSSTRDWIEETVLAKYHEELKRQGYGDGPEEGEMPSNIRSPIFPTPGPLRAGEARRLEWDV